MLLLSVTDYDGRCDSRTFALNAGKLGSVSLLVVFGLAYMGIHLLVRTKHAYKVCDLLLLLVWGLQPLGGALEEEHRV